MLPSLRENRGDWQQMLESLGTLYGRGVQIDWDGFDKAYQRRKVILPTYPFQRQPYWLKGVDSRQSAPEAKDERPHWAHRYLYQVAWQPQTLDDSVGTVIQPGQWLILADQEGVGEALAHTLRDAGHETTLLYAPQTNTSQMEALTDQLADLLRGQAEDGLPLRGVVHLWALDVPNPALEETTDMVMQQQEVTCGSLLSIVQCLAQQRDDQAQVADSPLIWAVTRGSQPLGADSPALTTAPFQTTLWGMGRVITLEQPDLWGGLIDLAPPTRLERSEEQATVSTTSVDADVAALHRELLTTTNEEQVAYRHQQRYVARLVQATPVAEAKPVEIHADGSYLITGGLGGLGLHNARWLAEQGATKLILTSRRGVTTAVQQAAIDSLAAMGIEVKIAQVDVADVEAMRALFAEIESASHLSPLRGVIHAAGVAGMKMLQTMTWEEFATVLRPKVMGGWILHHLTQELALDFFLCYASGAGIWGGKEQAHYGAANHFLDGLAAYRRGQSLPGCSLAWGPWAGAGMATPEVQATLMTMGIRALLPEDALALQTYLLEIDAQQMTVADLEWSRLRTLYDLAKPRPFFSALPKAEAKNQEEAPFAVDGTAVRQQSAAPIDVTSVAALYTLLQEQLATVLHLPTPEHVDHHQGFADLGMDSLMALEFKQRLERRLAVTLPATVAFEYPTVQTLADYLAEEVLTLGVPQSLTQMQSDVHRMVADTTAHGGTDCDCCHWLSFSWGRFTGSLLAIAVRWR